MIYAWICSIWNTITGCGVIWPTLSQYTVIFPILLTHHVNLLVLQIHAKGLSTCLKETYCMPKFLVQCGPMRRWSDVQNAHNKVYLLSTLVTIYLCFEV